MMLQQDIFIRVRYAETDQMGYVYYGNYATYFEVARVESLRAVGITYKALEQEGIMLPVLEMNIKYIRPARYDDLLKIATTITEIKGSRIYFSYDVLNEANELLTVATTTLVFVAIDTMKPMKCPDKIFNALAKK